jgi:hypothetical protein
LALLATLAATTPELQLKPPMEAPGRLDATRITLVPVDGDVDQSNPYVVAGVTAGMIALLGGWAVDAWWSDGLEPFSFRQTGAFEKNAYAGGADKVGHAYATYLMTHAMYAIYRDLGMSRTNALWWSSGAVFVVSNWVELIDGFTEFGFEHGDVIANTAGVVLGFVTRYSPAADDLLGFRIAYAPSPDFLKNEKSVLKWINDYTGMTFYFDVKAKGVYRLLDREPGFMRYVVGGVAFGTDQYSPVKRWAIRRRNVGVHVGLSLSEILRVWGEGDEGVESVATIFDYYAVPFLSVAVMKDLNGEDWFLNFGISNRLEPTL